MSATIQIDESYDSHDLTVNSGSFSHSGNSATIHYLVFGAASEASAIQEAYEYAPAKYYDDKLPKKQAGIAERLGDDSWKVNVEYGYTTGTSPDSDEEEADSITNGESTYDDMAPEMCFQASSSTQHIVNPINQVCVYNSTGVALTAAMAKQTPIGWDGKPGGNASGVDIPCGELRLQLSKIMKYDTVTSAAWMKKIGYAQNKVNGGYFHGFEPGEVMFLSASFSTPMRGVKKVKVTFDFLIRPNETNAVVGGIDIGNLKGHEYVWAVTGNGAVENTALYSYNFGQKIKQIFKSQLFYYYDFSKLGV